MTNISRRYYERELGAGMGPSPSMKEAFGYSEPLRRFIQHESFEIQEHQPQHDAVVAPSYNYMANFKVVDPYLDRRWQRHLHGTSYEALHPELKGLNPEDYPDIHKLRILSDVAPYSREYNNYRQKIAGEAHGNTELQIELEKIIERVRQTKESSTRMDNQGSPSCLTQNPARTRARPGPGSRSAARSTSAPRLLLALSLQAPSPL